MSSLSRVVVSDGGDRLISFQQVATMTETSVTVIQSFVTMGVVEPVGSMLRPQDVVRIAKIMRLRRDLGLNLVGAAMVLDMATEIAQLKAQLAAIRQ